MNAMFTNGAQLLGFSPLQTFGVYPWQACVPSGAGLWPIVKVQMFLHGYALG